MGNEDITKPEPIPPAVPKEAKRRQRRATDSIRVQLLHICGILVASTLGVLAMVYANKPGVIAAIVVAFATNAKQTIAGLFEGIANKLRRRKR